MDIRDEESALIEDILSGQRDQYRELVDRYAPMVFDVVNEFTDNDEDARELAQEIFVKTYERLSSFEGKSKFSTWLYTLAKNHCRDYAKNVRRQNRAFSEMDGHELEQKLGHYETPGDEFERKEWVDRLRQGLEAINEEYAEAFLMKYDDNMSYKAMSKRLDASVSALKVRVYRAKKELKQYLEQQR